MNLDPRVQALLTNEAQTRRFVAVALAMSIPPENLDMIFDAMNDRAGDMTAQVAGRPLAHWYGKTPADVRRELVSAAPETPPEEVDRRLADDEVARRRLDEVSRVMSERGLPFTDDAPPAPAPPPRREGDAPPPPGSEEAEKLRRESEQPPPVPTGDHAAALRDGTTPPPGAEPVFGASRIPLSKLRGKSDDELRKIPGIGAKTIEAIREAERVQDEQAQSLREVADNPAGAGTDTGTGTGTGTGAQGTNA